MAKKIKILKAEDVFPEIRNSNYFKLSGERSWGPRILSDYELIYIVGGEYSYTELENQRKFDLYEGDVLCIPPGVSHMFKLEKLPVYGGVISCIHLDLLKNASRLNRDYRPENEPPTVTTVKGDNVVHQLFRNCSSIMEGFTLYRDALLQNIGREIWLRLAEYWQGGNSSVFSPRVREMISFIEAKIPAHVTRQDLSREFGLTPEHINSLFKEETGMTPTQLVHRARINLACQYLLEEGLSIKETAEKVGFSDEFYFSKVFKKVMNITPGRIATG